MSNATLKAMMDANKTKIMTVTFTKKDGTERVMNCMKGVTKHLRGGDSTTAHKDNLVTVWDMQKGAYRCINLNTVRQLKAGGRTYTVE